MSEHHDDGDETAWSDLLERIAARDEVHDFRVEDDVRRGRARLVRNRVAGLAAAACVGVVVLGTGLALGDGRPGAGPAPAPAAPGPTAIATFHEPEVTMTPSPGPTAPTPTTTWLQDRLMNSDGPVSPFKTWRLALFATTQDVLDPSRTHLDYSNRGITASTSENGGVSMGIKMGWHEPGQGGQGMVQVEVGTPRSVQDACLETGGFGCRQFVEEPGGRMWVGDGPRGSFVVLHRQTDGDQVVVLVDPLFGNNSSTGVGAGFVTKADVYRLVQDDRLDLPREPS